MAKVGINTGTAANAGDGSALRAGANIINANFDEIYTYFGDGTTLDADLAGKWLAVATGINTLSNVGIGTTNPWNALTVLGNASITGVTTSSGGFVGDVTGDVTGNITGKVTDTVYSTFKDVLVAGASTFTGIGTFSSDLYVGGNLYTLGDISYDEVSGRNINITGIGTIAELGITDINVSGFSTFSGLSTTGSDLYINDSLYVKQDATVIGVITATTFTGNLSGTVNTAAQGSITSLGTLTALKVSGLTTVGSALTISAVGSDDVIKSGGNTLYVDSAALSIRSGLGTETQATFAEHGAVRLFYDNSDKLATTGTGVTVYGNTDTQSLNVSGITTVGTALTIHGDGTDDTIKSGGATLYVDSAALSIRSGLGTETQATFAEHGAVSLFYDNTMRLNTSGTGATVTGTLRATSAIFEAGGNIQADGDISVDGETELDNLNVTGVSTFTNTVNVTNASVKMTATNAYFAPPSLTSTQRDNATNLVAGALIWNEDNSRFEYYNGSAWRRLDNSSV